MSNPTQAQPFKPHQSSLLLAALVAAAAYFIPILRLLTLPIQYLNTHLHEMSHAIAAAATGGEVWKIIINANGSGVTLIAGGNNLIECCAGYLGASIIGACMIYFGRDPKKAKGVLLTLGIALSLSMLAWVRGDLVGIVAGLFWVGALFIATKSLQGAWLVFLVQFLGVEQCFTSVQSVLNLVEITQRTEIHNDALILANATGIPALLWAISWTLISFTVVGVSLRLAWHSKP